MKTVARFIVQALVNLAQWFRVRRRVKRVLSGKEFLKPGHLDMNKLKCELRQRYPRIHGDKEWSWRKRCEAVRLLISHYGFKVPRWPRQNGKRIPASPAMYSWHLEQLAKVAGTENRKAKAKRPGVKPIKPWPRTGKGGNHGEA